MERMLFRLRAWQEEVIQRVLLSQKRRKAVIKAFASPAKLEGKKPLFIIIDEAR